MHPDNPLGWFYSKNWTGTLRNDRRRRKYNSCPDTPWRTEGSVLIGLDLVRSVMGDEGEIKEQAHAKVVGWLSAAESDFEDTRGNPAPLYRIKYLDGALAGDEQDLEEYEVRNSVPDADRRALAAREGVPYPYVPKKKRKRASPTNHSRA